jgi:CBS domain-containing protein
VPRELPVRDAIRTMLETPTSCLLVGDGAHLEGILTERDLLTGAAGRPIDGLTVADVMTADPVVLRDEDTVAVAINTMAVGRFRHLPLVGEGGRPIGVVTATDLFDHILRILE